MHHLGPHPSQRRCDRVSLFISLEPDGTITIRPIRGKLDAFFHSLEGVAGTGSLEDDAAIMESVSGLDDATRKH